VSKRFINFRPKLLIILFVHGKASIYSVVTGLLPAIKYEIVTTSVRNIDHRPLIVTVTAIIAISHVLHIHRTPCWKTGAR